jgi:hypothetical protein
MFLPESNEYIEMILDIPQSLQIMLMCPDTPLLPVARGGRPSPSPQGEFCGYCCE